MHATHLCSTHDHDDKNPLLFLPLDNPRLIFSCLRVQYISRSLFEHYLNTITITIATCFLASFFPCKVHNLLGCWFILECILFSIIPCEKATPDAASRRLFNIPSRFLRTTAHYTLSGPVFLRSDVNIF